MQEVNNPTDELVESNLKLVRHVIKKILSKSYSR